LDLRLRGHALDENSCRHRRHNDVLRYDAVVFRLAIDHDRPRLKVGEGALVDRGVGLEGENAASVGLVKGISFEVAVKYLKTGVRHGQYTRNLFVDFLGEPVETENAVVHFEDPALDEYD